MSSQIPCLGIGLPPLHPSIKTHPDVVSGKVTREKVQAEIEKMTADSKNARECLSLSDIRQGYTSLDYDLIRRLSQNQSAVTEPLLCIAHAYELFFHDPEDNTDKLEAVERKEMER